MKETMESYLKRGGKITTIQYNEEAVKRELAKKYQEQLAALKKR